MLVSYAKVIESYDRKRSVIPMRFGSIFEHLAEVAELLESRQGVYRALLSELDGRTEMSVRFALDQPREFAQATGLQGTDREADCWLPHERQGTGMRYLANRRRDYAIRESKDRWRDDLSRHIANVASGTFVHWNSEYTKSDSQVGVEVHFLVPRHGIARFVETIGELKRQKGSRVAISGPWPAYNFATIPAIKSHPDSVP